jgi:hypothetical protein
MDLYSFTKTHPGTTDTVFATIWPNQTIIVNDKNKFKISDLTLYHA